MKKVLVTGAAGMIGLNVIKYLLSEGKYEITVLDLKNKSTVQKLKKYKKRVNIILGDVCNRVLIESLVKDHDIIIHLAGVLPPLANIKEELATLIDYGGTENIVRAINYYNPKCHLFYASSTTLYRGKEEVTAKSNITIDELDYYDKGKYDSENLIKKKLKFYTIYRLPFVLGDPLKEPFPLNARKDDKIEYITKEDAAYAFVKGIGFKDVLNKKVFNVTSENPIPYKELLRKVLGNCGMTWNFVINKNFVEKDYYSYYCKDRDELNNIINYRNDNIENYYNTLET